MNIYFKAVLKRKQYEEKFDVDVTDDPITGETKVKDRAKDEVLVLFESFWLIKLRRRLRKWRITM